MKKYVLALAFLITVSVSGCSSDTDKLIENETKAVEVDKESENQKGDDTDSKAAIQKDDVEAWQIILANPWNKLPEDFEVKKAALKNGHFIDERAVEDLQTMMDDARKLGLEPVICSSFRTMEKQKSLFARQIKKQMAKGYSKEKAEVEAAKWVALPGTSEHQTALALDIVASSYQVLDKKQEETAEQQWLMENSYKYGFILRYPEDKSDITGISYEPWHYRYVGKTAAKTIFEKGICLEEYLEMRAENNESIR